MAVGRSFAAWRLTARGAPGSGMTGEADDISMAKRVNLDAMIPRADFGLQGEEVKVEQFREFPISYLEADSPHRKLLRKPNFQRETNHWSPEQIVTFVASFLDEEVIPSLIFWRSPLLIAVLDGSHRLSALRAWIEDDYGDGTISWEFYEGEITEDQKRMAKRTRALIEERIGRYSTLRSLAGSTAVPDLRQAKRASVMLTRPLALQWVTGDPSVAETSFFKINTQGTPLDETERTLIRNRRKAVAIGARAVIRSGSGHKYWSSYSADRQSEIERLAGELFGLLFEPEVSTTLKTLDVSLGGSVSPVDASWLLVEFLATAAQRGQQTTEARRDPSGGVKSLFRKERDYGPDDGTGEDTILVLRRALEVMRRITGDQSASLGLHPAVYFYNERGKHNRFLLLGMVALVSEKIRNNDDYFFKKFTLVRTKVEGFLAENKSLIGILLQNMTKGRRVTRMRDLFQHLVEQYSKQADVTPESVIAHLGARGKIYDIVAAQTATQFTDEAKAMVLLRQAVPSLMKCPLCGGVLDPAKALSYDHVVRRRDGGTGDPANGQLTHPYCNSIRDWLESATQATSTERHPPSRGSPTPFRGAGAGGAKNTAQAHEGHTPEAAEPEDQAGEGR